MPMPQDESDHAAFSGVAREHVGFHGDEQFIGRVRIGAKHGLTADDDDLGRIRVARGRADDVFKLQPIHAFGIRG